MAITLLDRMFLVHFHCIDRPAHIPTPMSSIRLTTLGVVLTLATTSLVLSVQFGFSAIEAILVCATGVLGIAGVLIFVACSFDQSNEPLIEALRLAKREAKAVIASVRGEIRN